MTRTQFVLQSNSDFTNKIEERSNTAIRPSPLKIKFSDKHACLDTFHYRGKGFYGKRRYLAIKTSEKITLLN